MKKIIFKRLWWKHFDFIILPRKYINFIVDNPSKYILFLGTKDDNMFRFTTNRDIKRVFLRDKNKNETLYFKYYIENKFIFFKNNWNNARQYV